MTTAQTVDETIKLLEEHGWKVSNIRECVSQETKPH